MRSVKAQKTSLIYDLVDLAIMPAALLICAKAVGMALLNTLLKLDWGLDTIASSLFSVKVVYSTETDANMITSYTNLFMFICMLAGSMVVTSNSTLFNYKKASPNFVLKLARFDLLHLLKSSVTLYKEAFVWGLFLLLTTIYIFISFISGQTEPWIAGVSVLFCITFLWIMVQHIEDDILFHTYNK